MIRLHSSHKTATPEPLTHQTETVPVDPHDPMRAFQAAQALFDAGLTTDEQAVIGLAKQNIDYVTNTMRDDPRIAQLLQPMLAKSQQRGRDLLVELADERELLPDSGTIIEMTQDDPPGREETSA